MKYADVIPATGEKEEKPNFGPCVICGKYHNGDAADRLIGALHSLIHRFVALREYFAARIWRKRHFTCKEVCDILITMFYIRNGGDADGRERTDEYADAAGKS